MARRELRSSFSRTLLLFTASFAATVALLAPLPHMHDADTPPPPPSASGQASAGGGVEEEET
jgi:hypothetical protein